MSKTDTQIYLAYVERGEGTDIKIKVVFNSEYYPNELTCVESSDKNYSCEPIDFFNVLFKKTLNRKINVDKSCRRFDHIVMR